MSNAFEITEDDVFTILSAHGLVRDADDEIVATAFSALDFDIIEDFALAGDSMGEQTEYAYAAIEDMLIEEGIISAKKRFLPPGIQV